MSDLKEFGTDDSYCYWAMDYDTKLLDCKGNLWTWKYDDINKTNLPGTMIKSLEIEEAKELIREGIIGHKLENEIISKVNNAITIDELIKESFNYEFY